MWDVIVPAALQLVGSAVSGSAQNSAAKRAQQAQEQASREQLAFQRQVYNQTRQDQAPWLGAGRSALASLLGDLGLQPDTDAFGGLSGGGQEGLPDFMAYLRANPDVAAAMPQGYDPESWAQYHFQAHGRGEGRQMPLFQARQPTNAAMGGMGGGNAMTSTLERLRATPGYNFAVEEGQRGADATFGRMGMLRSGAAVNEAQRRRMGLADQTYAADYNRRAAIAGFGQTSANALMGANQNLADVAMQGSRDNAAARASSYQTRANTTGALAGSAMAGLGQIFQAWPQGGGQQDTAFNDAFNRVMRY
jgi:hypothetical protein